MEVLEQKIRQDLDMIPGEEAENAEKIVEDAADNA